MAQIPPIHYIHSAMRGAPIISGTRGTLIAALDAFLITGFGQVTANSVTVAGGVATVSLQPDDGFSLHANVLVAGATPAALNGVARVTKATATTIKFATDAPDGVAVGTITIKVAPVGWQKVFTAANKAVYRSTDVMGARHYLRVDETDTANLARVRGYEAMTTVDAGTGLYPTNAQVNGGGYWAKSVSVDAVAVGYDFFADSRFVFTRIAAGRSASSTYEGAALRGFGDPIALNPAGDTFSSCLSCGDSADTNSQYGGFDAYVSAGIGSVYMARARIGTGTAVRGDTAPYTGRRGLFSGEDPTLGAFPSPVDGQLKFSSRFINETDAAPRANVPGLLHVPQTGLLASSVRHRDFVEGSGALAGRTLVASVVGSTSTGAGIAFVDITGPWR